MATIGSLAVNITAVTDKFVSGIRTARNTLSDFSGKVSLIAGGVTAAIGGMLSSFDSTGSELHDLSTQTGIAVEKLSFLKYAAEQSSAGLDTFVKATRVLQDKGMDPNKFGMIAKAIASIKDPTERAGLAIDWFGKKIGPALLPMINDLPELQRRFEQLGGAFTDKMAKSADALGDSLGDLKLALGTIRNEIAAALAPAVTKLTNLVAENMGGIRKWIAENESLVQIVAGTAAALTLLAPAMVTLSSAVTILTGAVRGLGLAWQFASANPYIVFAVALAAALYFAYENIQLASDATYSFQRRAEALLSVVTPLVGVLAELARYTGILDSDINVSPAPATSSSGGATAPKSGAKGRATQESKEVAKNTGTLVSKTDETNKLLQKLVDKRRDKLQLAGVR